MADLTAHDEGRREIAAYRRSSKPGFSQVGRKGKRSDDSGDNRTCAPPPMGGGRGPEQEVNTQKTLAYVTRKTVQPMGVSSIREVPCGDSERRNGAGMGRYLPARP